MRACNTRNVRCNIVIRLCNHDARNDVYLRLLPELHTYKIVRRLIIRLKMVIVIISLSVWIPINDGIPLFRERNGTVFPLLYKRRGKKRKRNLYNFVSSNFLQRNENLFVACCRAYRSRRAARFQNFPRRPSIDAPRLDSFFRHGSNLHCWRSDASCARALRPSNALRFAWPRARTRGQRVYTYAKSGQDRCEPATWATC